MAAPSGVTMTSRVTGEKEKAPYEQCLDSIYEQKGAIETAGYGRNKASVQAALKEQTLAQQRVEEYGATVDSVLQQTTDEVQKKGLQDAYQSLKDVSQKKINCLNTMLEISTLEEHCSRLGVQFDQRAVSLVDLEAQARQPQGDNNQGFISPSSQDCIFAAEDNWTWLSTMVKCMDTHLKNGAQYHQFFHECDESIVWMLEDLKRLHNSFELSPLKGDYQDAERLTQELKDITVALKQWETKTDFLWEKARKVVPVHLRTKPTNEPLPARALCTYENGKNKIREGEDLLVVDTSGTDSWVVRNCRLEEFTVPALSILIPGPFKEAQQAAIKMRLQLLAAWTNTIKRVGQRMIHFMLLVFKNKYMEDEIKTLQSIPEVEKTELERVLDYVEDTLKVHWSEHQGFQTLQERILMLRMMLENVGDESASADESQYKSLVVQILILEKLMQKYKDLWKDWETYKTALEASQAPELMLIVDKWEQLKFVSRDYFAKRFWQNDLSLGDMEKTLKGMKSITMGGQDTTDAGAEESTVVEAKIVSEVSATPQESGMFEQTEDEEGWGFEEQFLEGADVEESEFGIAHEKKTAETEQLSKAEREETKRFIIRSVIDPRTDTEISLDEAILQGIICPQDGIYTNMKTGEKYPIPIAMTAGLIKVEFTTTRRTKETRSSIGIITVKTIKEHIRPYTILKVKDLAHGEEVDKEEAHKRGIIEEHKGIFLDKKDRKKYLLSDAIEKGYISVHYEGEAPEPEVVSTTYAVRAVVDRRIKKVVTFQEAVRRGIIDRDSGAFKDTLTGDSMYIGDAIMRGFLKARKIDDPTSLEIDPENKLVIDKTEKIRQKLLRPLRVLGAFKKAAMLAANNKPESEGK